jgi:hypothetical protein
MQADRSPPGPGSRLNGRSKAPDREVLAITVDPNETGRLRGLSVMVAMCRVAGGARACAYSFAAFFSSSALSVFSQENAVAVCFLPAPSTYETSLGLRPKWP